MSEKTTYIAATDGFILGRFRSRGEELELTPAQAEWELRAGRVRAKQPAPAQPVQKKKSPARKKED